LAGGWLWVCGPARSHEIFNGGDIIAILGLDGLPEQVFYLAGNIHEASTKAINLKEENKLKK
jgi:F-type H+/Na+-transporting ATPase subunit beta